VILKIYLKRAYELPSPDDGFRVLVDRVWPRGISKDSLKLDLWLRGIAPSTELRKWFNHDLNRWGAFQGRYLVELKSHQDEIKTLQQLLQQGPVTLVYGTKDKTHNQAVVLRDYLLKIDAHKE
jgi:uncharacterized protein YeaO (DUF488 family)